jgi:hypothetical protein
MAPPVPEIRIVSATADPGPNAIAAARTADVTQECILDFPAIARRPFFANGLNYHISRTSGNLWICVGDYCILYTLTGSFPLTKSPAPFSRGWAGTANDAAKEFSMQLSDLLVYAFLFFVSLAAGFAHGIKSDIADRRKAMKAGYWRQAA